MKRNLPYLAAAAVMVVYTGAHAGLLWRAAELSGYPIAYITWKLLVTGSFTSVLGGLGGIWFMVIAQRSMRAAIAVPISAAAVAGVILLSAAAPIATALIGPLTPAGVGTAGAVIHDDRWFRGPEALVITVARNGENTDQVPAFITDGSFPSGSVQLALDRNGNTWVAEPSVEDSIKTHGQFLLVLTAAVALLAAGAAHYFRRHAPPVE